MSKQPRWYAKPLPTASCHLTETIERQSVKESSLISALY